jgi:hypothetical protein
MNSPTPEPDLSAGEEDLQKSITFEVHRILERSNRPFVLIEHFGLDLALWLGTPPALKSIFLEFKVCLSQSGRVGFGNRQGKGNQVDLLMLGSSDLSRLEDRIRWIIADGSMQPGSSRYAFISSETVKSAAMGGVERGKQNNFRIKEVMSQGMTWEQLLDMLSEFLLGDSILLDLNSQLSIPPGAQINLEFTHEQLVNPDYDPIQHGDVDPDELRGRYPQYPDLHHAAAIRGVLVREIGGKAWRWIWGVGLLHDELLAASGFPQLFARYRNQFGMVPRIEFEPEADVISALQLLLETTPIKSQDLINIEAPRVRAASIAEYIGG